MDKIIFATKQENNERREKEFLALSPNQRAMQFLKMVGEYNKFESRATRQTKGNFIVEMRRT